MFRVIVTTNSCIFVDTIEISLMETQCIFLCEVGTEL